MSSQVVPQPRRLPRPVKLGTAVVEGLVDDIVRGVIAPGSSLPPEADLCAEFGVSRTVIRESIKIVQEKGLIRIEHGRGTQVTDPRQWNLLDDQILTAVIRHDESSQILDELVSVRTALEAEMAAAAAQHATPTERAQLAAALADMESLVDRAPDFSAADVRFHDIVMAMSRNRLGRTIVTSIHDKARTSMKYHGEYNTPVMKLTVEEHRAVYQAILDGSPDAAASAMRAHITGSWARRRPSNP
ncbi:FadR/GntR family transcriptional regulator [Catenuloplanes japonicus]|uniref:FadR/GntR family transcriptional regulator n=1 Tax=Catenuloplanes japonicus TaxID=33876 RepID=UPI0007C51221|nr:FadR/GntR family transcriptional regulator [Catenuloplanes japonicus]